MQQQQFAFSQQSQLGGQAQSSVLPPGVTSMAGSAGLGGGGLQQFSAFPGGGGGGAAVVASANPMAVAAVPSQLQHQGSSMLPPGVTPMSGPPQGVVVPLSGW